MNQVTIYKYNTRDVRAIILPDNTSAEAYSIMRVNNLVLSFDRPDFIGFQKGDYTNDFERPYKLNTAPTVNKISGYDYKYTLTMDPEVADLGKTQYLFLNSHNKYTEGRFDLREKPIGFLNLIVTNMLRKYGADSGWKAGFCIDADYQTLSYNGNSCLEVITDLAGKFNTEWICEGKTISLYKKQTNSGIVLSYGSGNTLYSITSQPQDVQDTVKSANRIYAYGSDKNIGSNYRNGAQRLRLADDRLYVERIQNGEEVVEKTVVFDGTNGRPEIYPHREGTVTSVGGNLEFTDIAIDFNINDYQIGGTTVVVTFNTGQLAGQDFDLHLFDNNSKTFTINTSTSQTLVLPNDTLKPAVGDTYVVTGIMQPLVYVTKAEAELAAAALKELNDNYADKLAFPVVCNPLTFKRTGQVLKIGQLVGLQVPEMEINRQIRVISYTRNVRNQFLYQPVLADSITPEPLIVKLLKGI